jgi:hypothetical protein
VTNPGIQSTEASVAHSDWPRVSVIVPVYNLAAYVEEALDSAPFSRADSFE